MCVDSLAHGPLSALSQPMCYTAACFAACNWIDTPAPLSEGYSGLLSPLIEQPDLSPYWWFIVCWLFLLSENTDFLRFMPAPCAPQPGVSLPISQFPFRPLFWLSYLSARSPGCRSRCPGWALVTCCARARCIVCWLFSINLSRKNGSLARRCERRSQFHTPQWKENLHCMGETGRDNMEGDSCGWTLQHRNDPF